MSNRRHKAGIWKLFRAMYSAPVDDEPPIRVGLKEREGIKEFSAYDYPYRTRTRSWKLHRKRQYK